MSTVTIVQVLVVDTLLRFLNLELICMQAFNVRIHPGIPPVDVSIKYFEIY